MNINQVINLIATITLVEMMLAIGLSVKWAEVMDVARNRRLVLRALLGNHLVVPAIASQGRMMCGAIPRAV